MSHALVLEMREIVRAAAEPWSPGDSIKAGIRRAARATGLTYRRTETFWHGRVSPGAIRALEADRLRAWHAGWLERQADRLEVRAQEFRARRAEIEARHSGAYFQGDLGLPPPTLGAGALGFPASTAGDVDAGDSGFAGSGRDVRAVARVA